MSLSHTTEVTVKLAIGPGLSLYGMLTLNNIALIFGIISSVIVGGHSAWKWWTDYQDRKARLAAVAGAPR